MNNWVDLLVPPKLDPLDSSWRNKPLTWAKANCPSYITVDAVRKSDGYYYRFYFGDEQDIIFFKLKWL